MRRGTVTKATLGTLFAIRRVYDEPVVDFTTGRKSVPAMPAAVPLGPPSLLGSWFRMNASMSGDQVDALREFIAPSSVSPRQLISLKSPDQIDRYPRRLRLLWTINGRNRYKLEHKHLQLRARAWARTFTTT